ncbi:MAG TPA: response regulator [Candidatus Sulfotelmatobacter sp.]|nr:response regulator [Candidatus Sulfotelmatobacter sp.]
MAKILVADDNSNIQKMVGLALKDHGIDVVAVGNGEAAVRKIVDVRPDLVLADVFMPVRNGYEVCQFVKADSTLSHIPVILLVGAFDPLDEQEAQRSGADGVLKKPFVPPDPLISMVKSALVRAGVAHAGFTPAKPVEEAPPPAPEPPAPAPRKVALPTFSEPEPVVDETPSRPAAVKIDSEQQPVAFGSLLGTDEEAEAETAVTAHPALERDWRTEEVEEEEEEETDAKPSWRRDAGDEELGNDTPAREGGWRESVTSEQPVHAHAKRHEAWTPTREKQDLGAAAEAEDTVVAASPIPDFRNMPAAPFSGDAWAAAIEAGSPNKAAVAEAEHPAIVESPVSDLDTLVGRAEPAVEAAPAVEEQSFVTEVPAPAPVVEVADEHPVASTIAEPTPETSHEQPAETQTFVSEARPSVASWFSTPPTPWEAEAQKATRLASTWDAPVAPPPQVQEPTPVSAPDEIEVVSGAVASDVIPAAVETAREEVHGSAEVDMDAVVEKVMARMSPEKLHELTRDLLKPVIEGIVRDELNKKS